MFKKTLLLLSLSSTALFCGMANADTSVPASMNVTLTVLKACTISMGDMNFGKHVSNAGDVDATAEGQVICTKGTQYSVSAASQSGFQMSGDSTDTTSADKVAYTLYSDQSRTNSLNTSGAQTPTQTGTGVAQDLTLYGRVTGSALQTAKAGDYKDVVTLVVNY